MEKQDLKQTKQEAIPSRTEEQIEEQKLIRRLQMMMNMVMQTFTHPRLVPVLYGAHRGVQKKVDTPDFLSRC
jgi:hypothetical protein